MKTRLLILSLSVIFTLYSCDKLEDLLTFTISHSASITIDSGIGTGLPIELQTPDVTTNSSQEFSNNKPGPTL
jgi:hypothetical protein